MDSTIPGTDVPDTAIHRASLWVNALAGHQEGGPPQPLTWDQVQERHTRLIEACGMAGKVTAEDIRESSAYYGDTASAVFPVGLTIVTPFGDIDLSIMFRSVWCDGLLHGIAVRDGKRGLSNAEIASQ